MVGKFVLVDLAGSEKASYSKNSGIRIREGANINKSLLALSNCINSMVTKKGHIPWRDSKLTRILQDSLGGNSKLVLIFNISPSILTLDETLYTLKYANRAKNIKKQVTQNFIPDLKGIPKFDNVIKNLNDEIEQVKMKINERNYGSSYFSSQCKIIKY